MITKIRKIIAFTLLSLSIICTAIYGWQKSLNTQIAQQKVVDRFINNFYDTDYTEDFNNGLETLLSSEYSLEEIDFQSLAVDSNDSMQANINYSGYSICQVSKEKVNGKKVLAYSVNVDFLNGEDFESPKKLYFELINENSQWKINKIMPRSV